MRGAGSLLVACAVAAACGVSAASAAADHGVYTNINDFNLCDNRITDGGNYNASVGAGYFEFRWLDDPDHTSVISANNPSTLELYNKIEIRAHDTSYHLVSAGYSYVKIRGRLAAGAGCMYYHDGRVNR